MRFLKHLAALSVTTALVMAVSGCGGTTPQQSDAPDESPAPIEQLANVNGVAVHLDENNKQATVEIEVAEGEALVQMARLDVGEAESSTSHDGEWMTSDYFYEGSGAGEMGVDPGTYTIEISTEDAEGTVWVMAYPADTIDYMNMDADQIVDFVLEQIS